MSMQDQNSNLPADPSVSGVFDLPRSRLKLPELSPLYTKEEVLQRFDDIFESLNLKGEIKSIGCGLYGVFKRGRSLREFTAMTISLWRLAMEKSFPDESDEFFRSYLNSSSRLGTGKKRDVMLQRIGAFWDLFSIHKTGDFTPISHYMSEYLAENAEDRKTINLKLTLSMRRIYKTIFEYLI